MQFFVINESENFSDSSLHDIFESENLGFFFSARNSVTWREKYETIKPQKIVRN